MPLDNQSRGRRDLPGLLTGIKLTVILTATAWHG